MASESLDSYILIIEDSHDILDLLRQLFEYENYNVKCASNGLEALQILRTSSHLPFLIFLDLMMPVMDGYQFRAEQLADARLATIPVVLMTAGSNAQAKSISMGVQGFLQKPVHITALLAEAKKYCPSSS
jgi:CheY-like chemotaxis protein